MLHEAVQVVEFRMIEALATWGSTEQRQTRRSWCSCAPNEAMQAQYKAAGYPLPEAGSGKYPIPILPAPAVKVGFQRPPAPNRKR
jgi:hypothetical protein